MIRFKEYVERRDRLEEGIFDFMRPTSWKTLGGPDIVHYAPIDAQKRWLNLEAELNQKYTPKVVEMGNFINVVADFVLANTKNSNELMQKIDEAIKMVDQEFRKNKILQTLFNQQQH